MAVKSMNSVSMRVAACVATTLAVCGGANAAEILVNSDITVSTTWTANNTYNLQTQIYVRNGATLTIEPGTVIASTTNIGGAIAVTRGAKIIAAGTQQNPIIWTSKADVATWTAGDPKTGTYRQAVNEWGNLTIMGRAYVSENVVASNTPTPNANNVAPMEGLVAQGAGDPNVLYGGGDDNDDSGVLRYCSFRYGGKVIGLNNELNGLSLGGIGRETDISYVEIMNNVDDGIEIWGGTVDIKYFSIWNVGDDSFDVDQGWRGKAQFGLIVQGHSTNAAQGSGVGDNAFEMDGGEDSDWQPVTTAVIYNCTVVGQPLDGDHATAWRDNARVQLRNCIFMDIGDQVVAFDNVDGDGGSGYGHNGTLSWAATWTTPYSAFSTVNAPPNPAAFYRAQTSGMLAEIVDSVFFNNTAPGAYTQANARGVFAAGNDNVQIPGSAMANAPIQALTRGPAVIKGGKAMVPVTFLDPRPKNQALTSARFAPRDGFFSQARYRGAFAPGNTWLAGWTASEAFGLTPKSPWKDLGHSLGGINGDPVLSGSGPLTFGSFATLALSNARPSSVAALAIGFSRADLPLLGGVLVPNVVGDATIAGPVNAQGEISVSFQWTLPPGTTLYTQYWVADAAAPLGLSASNGLAGTTP
jgi:hypothetical protein